MTSFLHIFKSSYLWDVVCTFVEEDDDLRKGLDEVDVVIAVILDLQQQHELGLALRAEHGQQGGVVLQGHDNMESSFIYLFTSQSHTTLFYRFIILFLCLLCIVWRCCEATLSCLCMKCDL